MDFVALWHRKMMTQVCTFQVRYRSAIEGGAIVELANFA